MYVYGKGILYCDLKFVNILLIDDGELMLFDFNFVVDINENVKVMLYGGILLYMVFEYFDVVWKMCINVDLRLDVYLLGVILFEFLMS